MSEHPQKWEYDFTNPPRIPPPGSQCEHCLQATGQPVYVKKFVERGMPRTFVFCNEDHANAYYLQRLREESV